MNSDLQEIIKQSSFTVEEGRFIYVKAAKAPNISNHFMVTKDRDEVTVVTKEEHLPEVEVIERNKENYSLIALNVSIPFYTVGFLATVSGEIAKAGMNILIVSTYSKDYILVREDRLARAEEVLLSLGFTKQ